MAEPRTTITTEAADEIRFGRSTRQEVSGHRWYTKYLIVFGDIGGHYGFYYLDPATEDQEGQDEYETDADGMVPVFNVEGHDETVTVWTVKE